MQAFTGLAEEEHQREDALLREDAVAAARYRVAEERAVAEEERREREADEDRGRRLSEHRCDLREWIRGCADDPSCSVADASRMAEGTDASEGPGSAESVTPSTSRPPTVASAGGRRPSAYALQRTEARGPQRGAKVGAR